MLAGLAYTLMVQLRRLALAGTELELSCTAPIRYTGLATCSNIPAALVGGTSLIVMPYLARHSLDYPAFYPALFCLLGVVAAILLWPRRHAINPFAAECRGLAV